MYLARSLEPSRSLLGSMHVFVRDKFSNHFIACDNHDLVHITSTFVLIQNSTNKFRDERLNNNIKM